MKIREAFPDVKKIDLSVGAKEALREVLAEEAEAELSVDEGSEVEGTIEEFEEGVEPEPLPEITEETVVEEKVSKPRKRRARKKASDSEDE